ncbi:ABC transporter permease [Marivirga harenae]|uniref:ABC transporter permease n=1 Tax=Marivirga harenae TaxID=2010992 RepID=UPI0026E05DEC|nr:ABC transporter permease [Marivirga harenae]WKV13962.1 ABC transporter permease [Marivirga harenae]|tara:strand:+ start:284981 stop:286324 length:1344 start_codon:yes stop_codon:yes gene_type:complete
MKEKILANLNIAFEAVVANRTRSFLTALGIIFGVAAVIAMLAIGNGAQQEILNQIKLVGVNNIVIEPVVEQTEENLQQQSSGKKEKKKFSPGLTLADAESIKEIIPGIEEISPEIILETYVIRNGIRRSAKLVGVAPAYFNLSAFELNEGEMFIDEHLKIGSRVCIIGKSVKARFFPNTNPVGKMIKVGPHWLQVIGVLKERVYSQKSLDNLGLRDFNMDIYTPVQTVLVNYKNRATLTQAQLKKANSNSGNGSNSNQNQSSQNYHQIDKLTVQVTESENLNATAEIISRMLKRRHYDKVDFEVTIPELLLKQQQKTKNIFNIVLGAIAGISLLVGGIGIMNIMLASVMERIKEIGLRLSLGAKKSDVVLQFLLEAVMISISGGIIGVILGIIFAYLVASFAEIPTIVSGISIVISFGVAATVGLIFGIAPARKAANQDPITSLRYE